MAVSMFANELTTAMETTVASLALLLQYQIREAMSVNNDTPICLSGGSQSMMYLRRENGF